MNNTVSEPIKLYDKDGNEVIRYSPHMAHLEVAAGLLFTQPPNVDEGMPALDGMPQDDEPTYAALGELVPICDDHGEVLTYRALNNVTTPHAVLGSITVGGSDQDAGVTLTSKRAGRKARATGQIL